MLKRLFGMRLHKAGKVIGWLGSFVSFLAIIVLLIAYGNPDVIANIWVVLDLPQELIYIVVPAAVCVFIFCILNIFWSIMLVVGTTKNRYILLTPWLVGFGFVLMLMISFNFLAFCMIISHGLTSEIFMLIVSSLVMGLIGYIYFGIFSLFMHIKVSNDQFEI